MATFWEKVGQALEVGRARRDYDRLKIALRSVWNEVQDPSAEWYLQSCDYEIAYCKLYRFLGASESFRESMETARRILVILRGWH